MRFFGLFSLLGGFYRIECDSGDSGRLANLLLHRGIAHGRLKQTGQGRISFTVSRKDWADLREIIDKCGILVYSVYGEGLPFLLRRYRRRTGMIAGFACFMLIVWLSTLFVWRVEVVSDAEINKSALLANLESIGVRQGMFIPATDFWAKSAEYLTTFDDCSWLSVNMVGTTAKIEARPMLRGDAPGEGAPCNITAAYGGVIDSFVIHSGKSYITAGDVVKPGDLLVCGIIEDIQGDFRLIESSAEVYAEIERSLTVNVPLAHFERVYTGRRKSALSFLFFGTEIALPQPKREKGVNWEESIEQEMLLLPDSTPLPFGKISRVWSEYAEKEEYYTAEQAMKIAELRLDKLVGNELKGAEILAVQKEYFEDGESVSITARIRCIQNIAQKKEIKINNGGGA